MFFSDMTKNLNLEMLPKNVVTFKRWDGMGWIFKGRVHEKPIYRWKFPKKGRLGQFAELRGEGLAKKRVVVFLRWGLIPQCTLCMFIYYLVKFYFSLYINFIKVYNIFLIYTYIYIYIYIYI